MASSASQSRSAAGCTTSHVPSHRPCAWPCAQPRNGAGPDPTADASTRLPSFSDAQNSLQIEDRAIRLQNCGWGKNTFLQNLWQGQLNVAEWNAHIACAIVEEIGEAEFHSKTWFVDRDVCTNEVTSKHIIKETNMEDYKVNGAYLRRWQCNYDCFREVILGDHVQSNITEMSEHRSTMTGIGTLDPLLHHAFVFFKLEDGFGVCLEKYNTQLEVILATWQLLLLFATLFRAGGEKRNSSGEPVVLEIPADRQPSLEELLGVMELYRWQGYDLFISNCQFYASHLKNAMLGDVVTLPDVDRSIVLAAVERNGRLLRHAPAHLVDDKEIVRTAVKQNGHALQYASTKLKDHNDIVMEAVSCRGTAIYYASLRLQHDTSIQDAAVRQCPGIAGCTIASIRSWEHVMRDVKLGHTSAVSSALNGRSHVDSQLLKAIQTNPSVLMYIPASTPYYADLVTAACLCGKPSSLAFSTPAVRKTLLKGGNSWFKIARQMILDGRTASIPEGLLTTKMCLEAVSIYGEDLQFVPDALKSPEMCLEAVRNDGGSLRFVPDALKGPEVCLEAVRKSIFCPSLQFVPDALKSPEVCLEAVRKSVFCPSLQLVPDALKSPEMCLEAVRKDGHSLRFVPDTLKSPEVCLEAVRYNADSLQFVPDALKSLEMCLQAIRRYGGYLQFVPDALKSPEVCLEAVRKDGDSVQFVPEALRTAEIC